MSHTPHAPKENSAHVVEETHRLIQAYKMLTESSDASASVAVSAAASFFTETLVAVIENVAKEPPEVRDRTFKNVKFAAAFLAASLTEIAKAEAPSQVRQIITQHARESQAIHQAGKQ